MTSFGRSGYALDAELEREAIVRARTRERFATMIEHLQVGVCRLGPNGQSLVSNPAYRKLPPDQPSRRFSVSSRR